MARGKFEVLENLESRRAALFVQTASKFTSDINVFIGEKSANAKSIMGVMSIGVIAGRIVEIVCEGEDEQAALDALGEFFAIAP